VSSHDADAAREAGAAGGDAGAAAAGGARARGTMSLDDWRRGRMTHGRGKRYGNGGKRYGSGEHGAARAAERNAET